MKKLLIIILTLFILSACSTEKQIVGGDADEHGCIGSAGYQWCPSTQQCQRMWEEYCDEFAEQFKITNFQTCVLAGNPAMESYPRQCRSGDIIYVEDLPGEPKKTYCLPNQKQAEFCTMEYLPVCGDNGKTYGNACGACGSKEIDYWISGEC